jgi:hypothetical protein
LNFSDCGCFNVDSSLQTGSSQPAFGTRDEYRRADNLRHRFKSNGTVHLKLDFKVDLKGLHDALGATAVSAINQNNAYFADIIDGRE